VASIKLRKTNTINRAGKKQNPKYEGSSPSCPRFWFKLRFVSFTSLVLLLKMLCSTGSGLTLGETDNDEYGVRPEDFGTELWVDTGWEAEPGPPELDTNRME
jgi:hypothetical protein